MPDLKLILVSPEAALTQAWARHFAGQPAVVIAPGLFESLPEFDCMVAAANSFGLMDGGVDGAIIHYFGVELLRRVQQRIVTEFLGEQPVGTSLIVETGHRKHPFIAHTPTMRVPMTIAGTDHPYTAMWAMLVAVHRHNLEHDVKIRSVACPGLGTGTGEVPMMEAARQMAAAYRHFLSPPEKIDWRRADAVQEAVRRGGDLGFQLARAEARRWRSVIR